MKKSIQIILAAVSHIACGGLYISPSLDEENTFEEFLDSDHDYVEFKADSIINCKHKYYSQDQFEIDFDAKSLFIITKELTDKFNKTEFVNCKFKNVRIEGLGKNGEDENVLLNSLNENATELAQKAAPSHIRFKNCEFVSENGIPFYISPGVNNIQLIDSKIVGRGESVAIYMDAESGHNVIHGNRIDFRSNKREVIAVDGSAWNTITENNIITYNGQGIHFYRNCGEGGTIRHQKPNYNYVARNSFTGNIVLNSRNGNRRYCGADEIHGLDFGSAISNYDYAEFNLLEDNMVNQIVDNSMNKSNVIR